MILWKTNIHWFFILISLGNHLVMVPFLCIPGGWVELIYSSKLLTPQSLGWAILPTSSRHTKQFVHRASWSFSVRGQNLKLWLLHDAKPPSFLLVVWESYSPSRTTTSIYMDARLRVKTTVQTIRLNIEAILNKLKLHTVEIPMKIWSKCCSPRWPPPCSWRTASWPPGSASPPGPAYSMELFSELREEL